MARRSERTPAQRAAWLKYRGLLLDLVGRRRRQREANYIESILRTHGDVDENRARTEFLSDPLHRDPGVDPDGPPIS